MKDRSEIIGNLVAALAAAQGAFEPIKKNRTVDVTMRDNKGKYSYSYATLDSVIDATRAALSENGLALTSPVVDGVLTVYLMHASGEWLASTCKLPSTSDWQGYGSALTYARRYLISSLLGVASEYDDDGQGATGNEVVGAETKPDPMQPLWDAFDAKGISEPKAIKEYCERALGRPIPTANAIKPADLPVLLATLEGKRELPPVRVMASKAEADALNKALEVLKPWGDALLGCNPEQVGPAKKEAKLAWINGMLKPTGAQVKASTSELTSKQIQKLIKHAEAGEVPAIEGATP